jgi:lipopolysaccharide/colanic/teichoic acid biosynthesis glycosyltransferase
MIKRIFDVIISLVGVILFFPFLFFISLIIWKHDKKLPFYISPRSGKNGVMFNMLKLRSMVMDADKAGINSIGNNDKRITPIGKKIRRLKLDEFPQLWNVLIGDMSFVGPRPNVKDETDLYTNVEKNLLLVKPGITDFSSIVFFDEGKILADKKDPDLSYNQLIRPWKSRLGLIYIKHQSILLDLQIILFTLITFISKDHALSWVSKKLENLEADKDIVIISKRKTELVPHPPPGSDYILKKWKREIS